MTAAARDSAPSAGGRRAAGLRVGIVAGEASGDALGAGLIEALEARAPGAEFFGIAGPRMIAAGCTAWYHAEELSVMGLAEVVRHLPRLLRLRRALIRRLVATRPDVVIGIDSPDFNLPVEAALKRSGVPTVQYVSPQVWAWRQSRVASVRRSADLVLCLLPFEPDFYQAHGVNAVFVGHPLADEVALETNASEARARLGVAVAGTVLGVLPGSRKSEVSRLAEPFMRTAQWLMERRPDLTVLVALASESARPWFVERTGGLGPAPPPRVFTGRAREVIAASDVVLTASGTASLEATLIKRPMVVAYIISRVTHGLLKRLGLRQLPYFSLPNLLAGRALVPEYLQDEVRAEVLGPALELALRAGEGDSDWYDACTEIHRQLRRDANAGAAEAVLALLGRGKS